MTFAKQASRLVLALLCLSLTSFAIAQQAAKVAPVTEDALRARFTGKLIFLRESYIGDELNFDADGKIKGTPASGSFTLSAFEVKKVKLSKHKLEIQADRYGLHFLGGLPYEDDSKSFDKVLISKKPVRIEIERELVVNSKAKKEKKKEPTPQELAAAQTLKNRDAAPAATDAPKPATTAAAIETAEASPEHSAVVMNKALDSVFASDLDPKMLSRLPDYWQEYFKSKSEHRPFMPADASIKPVSEGIAAPKILNSIDPTSNEYAQKFGIAGLDLVRTVVDATGVPRQMAIARPIGFGLDEKAVEAVKNSRFRPATLNGQPVPVVIDIVVTFRIYSNLTKPGSVGKGSKDSVLAASVGESGASLVP